MWKKNNSNFISSSVKANKNSMQDETRWFICLNNALSSFNHSRLSLLAVALRRRVAVSWWRRRGLGGWPWASFTLGKGVQGRLVSFPRLVRRICLQSVTPNVNITVCDTHTCAVIVLLLQSHALIAQWKCLINSAGCQHFLCRRSRFFVSTLASKRSSWLWQSSSYSKSQLATPTHLFRWRNVWRCQWLMVPILEGCSSFTISVSQTNTIHAGLGHLIPVRLDVTMVRIMCNFPPIPHAVSHSSVY